MAENRRFVGSQRGGLMLMPVTKFCSFRWPIEQISFRFRQLNNFQSCEFSADDDNLIWVLQMVFIREAYDPNIVSAAILLHSDWKYKGCSDLFGCGRIAILNCNENEVIKCQNFNFNFTFSDPCTMIDLKAHDLAGRQFPGDKMIVRCELSYRCVRGEYSRASSDFRSSHSDFRPSYSNTAADSSATLTSDLERILKDELFTDVTISLRGKNYPLHRAFLAARSPVFKSMFSTSSNENNVVKIDNNMYRDTFDKMLLYIYTGKAEELEKWALHLLPAAEKYKLEELKQMCEETMIKDLSVTNVPLYLLKADENGAERLKENCLRFIRAKRAQFQNIRTTELWDAVKRDRPQLLEDLLAIFFYF
ncbi:speckle-type POZ protein-like B [Planococcus citri]|uniref:speckle-type POZ protein-like B n=1 Tax=Planococcus citri TaxID=170843 RepID=UPI0031F7EF0B